MDVDEARRERETLARNGDERIALRAVADDGDSALGQRHIGDEWRAAVAIVNAGVPENRVQQRLA